MTLFLYSLTVILWGTTWIAITLQNGSVDTVVSIFYRFVLAGLVLFVSLVLFGKLQKTKASDHLWFLLQGCCLFCFNFICIYSSSAYLTSGLISIIFSLSVFYNAFNNRLFWKVVPAKSIYLAGIFGIIGLTLLFWQELADNNASNELFLGIGLAALGTYFFSLGNMISVQLNKRSVNTLTSNAYGMNYGAIVLFAIIMLTNKPFVWDDSNEYFWSLLYLSIPGSVIGFTAYISLIKRIGANQAAYATVLFPVIALAISSVYEDYSWGTLNILGLLFVLYGNAVALNLFSKSDKTRS